MLQDYERWLKYNALTEQQKSQMIEELDKKRFSCSGNGKFRR
jgi:hypothetical protein